MILLWSKSASPVRIKGSILEFSGIETIGHINHIIKYSIAMYKIYQFEKLDILKYTKLCTNKLTFEKK